MAGSKSPLIDKTLESAKNITKNVVKNVAANAVSMDAPQAHELTTPDYSIDYTDERFASVNSDKAAALDQSNAQFDQMISGTDTAYQGLIDAAKQQGDTLAKNQQDRTDFAIEQINQQKDQAQKDYSKEQRAAYIDWQKQSDPYGVAAEQMAAQGMRGTGYSESSQVAMYTAYQNRVAVARESYNQSVLNYNNAIKDAQLANNSALAEIAMNTLQTTLTLGLEKLQYNNDLLLQKQAAQREIDNTYYNRWQDVLAQQNTENALAEQIRQFNASMLEDRRQFDANYKMSQKQHADDMAYKNASLAQDQSQFDATMEYNKGRDKVADSQWLKEFNEGKRQYNKSLAEDKRQYNKTFAENQRQFNANLAEDQRQFNNRSSSGGGSGGGSGAIDKSGDDYEVSTAYYQGKKNSDAKKYGTFSNGYQPKGISGHGKVSVSYDEDGKKDTITLTTQTLYGQKQTLTQNVWKTPDGKKWYWDGTQNKYIQLK